jgi:hypothetical protein
MPLLFFFLVSSLLPFATYPSPLFEKTLFTPRFVPPSGERVNLFALFSIAYRMASYYISSVVLKNMI